MLIVICDRYDSGCDRPLPSCDTRGALPGDHDGAPRVSRYLLYVELLHHLVCGKLREIDSRFTEIQSIWIFPNMIIKSWNLNLTILFFSCRFWWGCLATRISTSLVIATTCVQSDQLQTVQLTRYNARFCVCAWSILAYKRQNMNFNARGAV